MVRRQQRQHHDQVPFPAPRSTESRDVRREVYARRGRMVSGRGGFLVPRSVWRKRREVAREAMSGQIANVKDEER